jgi:hypothetical protein
LENIQTTLQERARTHGDYRYVSHMAQNLKTTLKSSSFYNDLDYYMIEALEMIATKQGRILAGNALEKEHWRDIAGYAMLVVNEIDRAEREQLMDRAMSSVRVEEPNDQQPTE